MLKFILRRCLEAIPTLFILITISFFMMRLAPAISVHRLNIKIIRSMTWLHPVFPFLPNWEPQHFFLR